MVKSAAGTSPGESAPLDSLIVLGEEERSWVELPSRPRARRSSPAENGNRIVVAKRAKTGDSEETMAFHTTGPRQRSLGRVAVCGRQARAHHEVLSPSHMEILLYLSGDRAKELDILEAGA